jgi:uncharacterized membrane protein YjgN (DUF898 family)
VARRRSPEFLLVVLGILLTVSLAAVVYGHIRYTAAETVYENHLRHVVISPHSNLRVELAGYAQSADKWLRIRTAASVLAVGAIAGVLWQVVRRRNERLAAEAASS